MKRTLKYLTLVVCLVGYVSLVGSQEGSETKTQEGSETKSDEGSGTKMMEGSGTKMMGTNVMKNCTLEGQNVSIASILKEAGVAEAVSRQYIRQHVFKVTSINDSMGEKHLHMQGMYLHYLENVRSKGLLEGNDGEKIRIQGTLYHNLRIIDVESFEIIQ